MIREHDRKYFHGPEGRRLSVREWGSEKNPPVLLMHGFLGCADQAKLMSRTPRWDSIRMIAIDRPGYGESDPQRELTPARFAETLKSVLDARGIENFAILSISGGAPYALALAALLGSRVRKIVSVSGVAPLNLRNFRFVAPLHKKAFYFRKLTPDRFAHFAFHRAWPRALAGFEEKVFGNLDMFIAQDRKVLEDQVIGPLFISTTKAAIERSPAGVLLDMKTYSRGWGIPLEKVAVPTTLWHGSLDDIVNARFAHELKRHLPHADLRIVADEGHYSLLLNHMDAIYDGLV